MLGGQGSRDALERTYGVGPGDHVGIDLYNCIEYVEAMLACWKLRAVPINVNYRYVASELEPLFDNATLVGVVCDEQTEAAARAAAATKEWIVKTGDEYEALVASGAADRSFGDRSPDDHYVLYTGGTTGTPARRCVAPRRHLLRGTRLGEPGRSADRDT